MKQSLSQYCGLMAKPLIQKIEQIKKSSRTKNVPNAMDYQFTRVTYSPHELANTLHSINYSIQLIQQKN
jgi:hypothetical protein